MCESFLNLTEKDRVVWGLREKPLCKKWGFVTCFETPCQPFGVCDREAVFLRAAHTWTLPPADMPADTANFHIPHTSSFSALLSRADASGRADGGTSGGEVGGRGGERGRGEQLSTVWATNSYGGLQDGHLQVTFCDVFLKKRSWLYVCGLMCKWCVCWLSDTPCSPCWRCSLRNASNPLRARSAWPRPASMWISRTLCETRRKKARLSSVRTLIWTIW